MEEAKMVSMRRIWMHRGSGSSRIDLVKLSCKFAARFGFRRIDLRFLPFVFFPEYILLLQPQWNVAHAEIYVRRSGTSFQANFNSEGSGLWYLKGGSGETCQSGTFSAGKNRIALEKVPPNLNLIFETYDSKGELLEQEKLSGQISISPLPKVEGGSVIYQLAPRTYFARGLGERLSGKLTDLTTSRLEALKDLGVDYLWLTGVLENASQNESDPDAVKGNAGSYYAIVDKWDVASSLGKLSDLHEVINEAHRIGLRVLIDLVPNHTARVHRTDIVCKTRMDFGRNDVEEYFSDHRNNYFYLKDQIFSPPYKDEGLGEDGLFDRDLHNVGLQSEIPAKVTGNNVVTSSPSVGDWYETVKLNYGWDFFRDTESYVPRPKTWDQILDVGRYWVEQGVDGFRVDFAHSVPIPFWRYFASELRKVNPNVFLVAEAYESDELMKYPGFSYDALLDAGFDSVYDSYLYWTMYREVRHSGNMREASFFSSPAGRAEISEKGHLLTRYMENHDEVRIASYRFAPDIPSRERRSLVGLSYTAFLALMPGHLMLHGGQELQEDAEIYGPFAGYDGRTSIFDYVYQYQTNLWLNGKFPAWLSAFRSKYRDLLHLKRLPVFRSTHRSVDPSIVELRVANLGQDEARWIGAYLRFKGDEQYVVVINSDPFNAHLGTLYLTGIEEDDRSETSAFVGEKNPSQSFRLKRVWSTLNGEEAPKIGFFEGREGEWVLQAPMDEEAGVYLGHIPAGTTVVYKLEQI
jgi:glycosidase